MLRIVPTEDQEQSALVLWCEARGLRLTAVPNSTYTTSWSQKAKNARVGLRAGFPDLIVLVSPKQSADGQGYFLCIEMKRQAGGTISPVQRAWIEAILGLEIAQVVSVVCKGKEDAASFIEQYLAPTEPF